MRNKKGQFVKGTSGNAGGKPRLSKELLAVKHLGNNEFKKIVAKYVRAPKAKLDAAFADPDTPSLDLAIIRILQVAIKTGDHARISFLLDRTIGKVKEVKELVLPEPTLIVRPNGENIELGARLPVIEGEVMGGDESGSEAPLEPPSHEEKKIPL